MPPKKRQRGQQALTEAQRAQRVCSICAELQDIWPQLGDVESLPACDSSSREASRASSRRTSMAGDV
jgi:hypothetical protein